MPRFLIATTAAVLAASCFSASSQAQIAPGANAKEEVKCRTIAKQNNFRLTRLAKKDDIGAIKTIFAKAGCKGSVSVVKADDAARGKANVGGDIRYGFKFSF